MYYFVFDVNTIHPYRDPYAVSWEVVDEKGQVFDKGTCAFDPIKVYGLDMNSSKLEWFRHYELIPPTLDSTPEQYGVADQLEETFWSKWVEWKGKDAFMACWSIWPEVSVLMTECIENERGQVRSGSLPKQIIQIETLQSTYEYLTRSLMLQMDEETKRSLEGRVEFTTQQLVYIMESSSRLTVNEVQ